MTSKGNISSSESDLDHLYYNGYLYNDSDTTPLVCSFQDNRSQALLENASDWVASVIRFQIPSSSIPIFIFQDYKYVMGLTYSGSTYTAPVTYTSNGYPLVQGQEYVWSVDQFLRSCNAALAVATSSLTTAFPGLASTITFSPYITYSPTDQLFRMNASVNPFDNSVYAVGTGSPGVGILMNSLLWTKFFITFQTVYSQTTNYEQIYMSSNYGQYLSNGILSVPTDVECVGNWSDLLQLVLISCNLPTRSEGIPPPPGFAGSSLNQQVKQIGDFEPPANATDAIDALAYNYLPTGQFRWVDLVGNGKLNTIDAQAYWKDRTGLLHPIYLLPHENFTIKILFVSKRLIKGGTDFLTYDDIPTIQQMSTNAPFLPKGGKKGRLPAKTMVSKTK